MPSAKERLKFEGEPTEKLQTDRRRHHTMPYPIKEKSDQTMQQLYSTVVALYQLEAAHSQQATSSKQQL